MKDLILFIHGFGSSHRCWKRLFGLLSEEERIMSLYDLAWWDYPTSWFELNMLGRIPTLRELGRALGEEIDSPRYRGRTLTLIGHSQGGLVIQNWMADLVNKGEAERLGNIRQVLLIATPNSGSTTAMGLRVLAYSLFTNPQEATLRVLCPDVAETQAVIRERIVYATEDSTRCWRVPVHAFCGLQDAIVSEASARGCFESVKPVPGNHFSILRPTDREDRRYSELVERLLDPGGHVHRFEVEFYGTVLRVEPREPNEIRVEGTKNPRTVCYDNYAYWKRTVRFAAANRCHDDCFTLRYKTRNEGYLTAIPSHDNLAPPAEIGRWKDDATEYRFDFKDDGKEEHSMEVEVYKGFDAGEGEIHFHLGNKGFYRRMEYQLDLSVYIRAGYRIIDGPHCYFQNRDHECNELCRKRSTSNLVAPTSASVEDGIWRFCFANIGSGVVSIVWDVVAVEGAKPVHIVKYPPGTAGTSIPRIALRSGETALIGFGSLLSVQSLSISLKRTYDGPFFKCHLAGWRRSWDAMMPNDAFYFVNEGARIYPERILYLNARLDPATQMNCVVYVLPQHELEAIDQREWIYKHRVVTEDLRDVQIEGGEVVLYVADDHYIHRGASDRSRSAVRASYVRILDEALTRMPADFRKEYAGTSDSLPRDLLIEDVLDPERPNPWARAGFAYRPEDQLRP
jgi:pimeloyl-ACP methyl ester carboxylesterase